MFIVAEMILELLQRLK